MKDLLNVMQPSIIIRLHSIYLEPGKDEGLQHNCVLTEGITITYNYIEIQTIQTLGSNLGSLFLTLLDSNASEIRACSKRS